MVTKVDSLEEVAQDDRGRLRGGEAAIRKFHGILGLTLKLTTGGAVVSGEDLSTCDSLILHDGKIVVKPLANLVRVTHSDYEREALRLAQGYEQWAETRVTLLRDY